MTRGKYLFVFVSAFFLLLFFARMLPAAEVPQESQAQQAEAWDKIGINMPAKEVEAILGKPLKKERLYGYDQILYEWKYPGGGVIRFYMNQVRSVHKPKTLTSSAEQP